MQTPFSTLNTSRIFHMSSLEIPDVMELSGNQQMLHTIISGKFPPLFALSHSLEVFGEQRYLSIKRDWLLIQHILYLFNCFQFLDFGFLFKFLKFLDFFLSRFLN